MENDLSMVLLDSENSNHFQWQKGGQHLRVCLSDEENLYLLSGPNEECGQNTPGDRTTLIRLFPRSGRLNSYVNRSSVVLITRKSGRHSPRILTKLWRASALSCNARNHFLCPPPQLASHRQSLCTEASSPQASTHLNHLVDPAPHAWQLVYEALSSSRIREHDFVRPFSCRYC
ncbi:hypothetical protein GOP47_0022603 [Adiantum capillus-veneris]|uniref:Uncharacterized protein n=1 Tax=Adiantum capillus-veneris TaxID=13818 RepID=A0A9D4Z5H5_ADICA|nr:hypothetical protein GOP47_0022603 [Adiantum capillus-veneris]